MGVSGAIILAIKSTSIIALEATLKDEWGLGGYNVGTGLNVTVVNSALVAYKWLMLAILFAQRKGKGLYFNV